MTGRTALLLALALLGGCHKRENEAGAPDAGADARARTAAKTLADLAAAEQASGTPLPRAPAARAAQPAAPRRATPLPDDAVSATDANDSDG